MGTNSGGDGVSPAPERPPKKKKKVRRGVGETLLIAWHRLRGGQVTPARAAFSVVAGIMVGCTPFWGVHFVLLTVLCLPLRLDLPVAYLASQVSFPVFAPFIFIAEIHVGALVLGRPAPHLEDLNVEHLESTLGIYFWETMIGAGIVGAALSVVGAGLAVYLVKRRKDPAGELLKAAEASAQRYGAPSSGEAQIVLGRLKGDPLMEHLRTAQGSLGTVLDAGCGRGEVGVCLAEMGHARTVRGIDVLEKIVGVAGLARSETTTFEVGDVREAPLLADTIIVSDVLRLLDAEDQEKVIQRCAEALSRGGRLVVRDLDGQLTFRTRLNSWLARLSARAGGFKGGLHLRSSQAWTQLLESVGLECEAVELPATLLYGNTLVVGTKPRGSSSNSDAVMREPS